MIALSLLIVSSVLVFYILIGYPLWLAASKPRPLAVAKDPAYLPAVTVVVAVHNGEPFIQSKLDTLLALDYPPGRINVIIVADGCTDSTSQIVRRCPDPRVQLIEQPRSGKAQALNVGVSHAQGELVFFTDVRQPLHPAALRLLVANLADPSVGAVSGELRIRRGGDTGEQADLDLYWRYELWVRRQHSNIFSLLVTTGCIYLIRRSLWKPLQPDTLTDDAVVPIRIALDGYRVVFEPEALAYDYPVSGGEFRRRCRTLAGLWQVHARIPQVLSPRNRMYTHFFWHKSCRLLLPWLILLSFAATAALAPGPFKTFLLLNELALIVLAAADYLVPAGFPLKKLSSPAKTFLVMNLASMAALFLFLRGAPSTWSPTQVRR